MPSRRYVHARTGLANPTAAPEVRVIVVTPPTVSTVKIRWLKGIVGEHSIVRVVNVIIIDQPVLSVPFICLGAVAEMPSNKNAAPLGCGISNFLSLSQQTKPAAEI